MKPPKPGELNPRPGPRPGEQIAVYLDGEGVERSLFGRVDDESDPLRVLVSRSDGVHAIPRSRYVRTVHPPPAGIARDQRATAGAPP